MITFLLIVVVLLLIPGVRQILGMLVWFLVAMWAIGYYFVPHDNVQINAKVEPPATAEPVVEPPQSLPQIGRGTGIDYGPIAPIKPRPYIQH
jgi:hypothetical protein